MTRKTTSLKVERLFQTLKKELELYKDLELFRYNYNCQRLHKSLEYKIPLNRFYLVSYVWGLHNCIEKEIYISDYIENLVRKN